MNFKPVLVEQILAGRKCVTRRPVSDNPRSPYWREECAFKAGHDYALCPGRGKPAVARIEIVSTLRQPVGGITNSDAVLEGFRHRGEFFDYWAQLYGGEVDLDQLVWRIAFNLVKDGRG